MTTSLDTNRRGFLWMMLGAAAAAVAVPLVERMAASPWSGLLHRIRGITSRNSITKVVGPLGQASVADAFSQVERWDLRVRRVFVHSSDYHDLLASERDVVDERGPTPHLWGAEVLVSDEFPRGQVFVVDDPSDDRGVAEIRVFG